MKNYLITCSTLSLISILYIFVGIDDYKVEYELTIFQNKEIIKTKIQSKEELERIQILSKNNALFFDGEHFFDYVPKDEYTQNKYKATLEKVDNISTGLSMGLKLLLLLFVIWMIFSLMALFFNV